MKRLGIILLAVAAVAGWATAAAYYVDDEEDWTLPHKD